MRCKNHRKVSIRDGEAINYEYVRDDGVEQRVFRAMVSYLPDEKVQRIVVGFADINSILNGDPNITTRKTLGTEGLAMARVSFFRGILSGQRHGKICDEIKQKEWMRMDNLWDAAKQLSIQTGKDIVGGFDVGFDDAIEDETKDALMRFVYWVEDNYHLPVTLWVDFKYRHYLVDSRKKRVGYRFYWADFESYPVFDHFDDIPVIELPVRTEKCCIDEILTSFIEAITFYFAWLSNLDMNEFAPDEAFVEAILHAYQNTR